jgi:hypothetical protein
MRSSFNAKDRRNLFGALSKRGEIEHVISTVNQKHADGGEFVD